MTTDKSGGSDDLGSTESHHQRRLLMFSTLSSLFGRDTTSSSQVPDDLKITKLLSECTFVKLSKALFQLIGSFVS